MKKALKWIGIVLAGLVGLLIIAVLAIFVITNARINKTYDIQPEAVVIPTDEQSLARGKHLAVTRGCVDCHGENLGGAPFIEDPALGSLYAGDLTSGQGGIGGAYTDLDWVRAIRHGVGPDGRPLLYMPSQEFYYLGDEDLGALIAYLKTVPAVDNELPPNSIGPLGRILFLAGQLPLLPVESIDHTGPRPEAPQPGVTVAYGQYLAVGCQGCHGPDFTGGPIPGAPPDATLASNITPAGDIGGWAEEDFIQTMRTGVTPDGRELDGAWMPWRVVGQMTDDELKALWLFLGSLPAKETASR